AEDVGGVEVGVVEGIDIRAQSEPEGAGKVAGGDNRADGGKLWLDRRQTARFDRSLVGVGTVDVGDDRLHAGVDHVGEHGEGADAGAVGGNLGVGLPLAVGVEVEIVAGLNGGIDVGDDDTVCGG